MCPSGSAAHIKMETSVKMDNSIKIERVTEADAQKLLKIYGYYVANTAISFEYEIPSVDEFKERIRNISSKYPYIKAVDDNGDILGYAYATAFKGRAAYDWSVESTIYIDKDYRHSGIGRSLYEALEDYLKYMGILNMNACIAYTESEDEHLTNGSRYFHEKLGYELVGTFHKSGYKFGKWYDMIWMEKMLGKHSGKPDAVRFGEWNMK